MKTTEEKNMMIDAFMGHKLPHWYPKYDTSWDWLMPVIALLPPMHANLYRRLSANVMLNDIAGAYEIVCNVINEQK